MKRKGIHVLAFVLAMAVLLTANPVLAQSVSENDVCTETELSPQAIENGENQTAPDQTETENSQENDNQDTLDMNTTSGNDIWAGREDPDNPADHCMELEENKWSYVYFGSYPQTEVTNPSLIAAIEAAMEHGGKESGVGKDVWLNGVKYRRISVEDTTDDICFGKNKYRYFRWERIKWRVLYNDGNKSLVMADQALDCKRYDESYEKITWENCGLRKWLNDDFYKDAFSTNEQNAILVQYLINEDYTDPENESKNVDGGNPTNDKVFLLSRTESMSEKYGFFEGYPELRCVNVSNYANARGTLDGSLGTYMKKYKGKCCWWLRSISKSYYADYGSAACVYYDGNIKEERDIDTSEFGVVPVLCVPNSSKEWSFTTDGTSGSGGEDKVLSAVLANKTKTTYWTGETLQVNDISVTAVYQVHADKQLQPGQYTTNAAQINMKTSGQKTLTVSYQESGITKTTSIPITVNKLVIGGPSKKLAAGTKVLLKCKVLPLKNSCKAVTWKSSNSKYATVDKNGKVTLKKAGIGKTVTITATTTDGSKQKASYKIKIMKHAVKSIQLKTANKSLKAGKSMTIKAVVKSTGENANEKLSWTSSNKAYATVNSKGKVTAKEAGKGKNVIITASSTDGSNKKAKVKIKIK